MSIHDFHSKLASGKEEGSLIEALRRMAKARSLTVLLAQSELDPWSVWREDEEGEGGAGALCEAGV